MTSAELQVLVRADLSRAHVVASIQGLPEQLAEEACTRVLEQAEHLVRCGLAAPGELATDAGQLRVAILLARLLACVGFRESALRWIYLDAEGRGEDRHGWDEWQVDDRSHALLVDAIRTLWPRSLERRRMALRAGAEVLLESLAYYPGDLEAGVCKYNASKDAVDRGRAEGNPNKHTTGHNYARGPGKQPGVLDTLEHWWPATDPRA